MIKTRVIATAASVPEQIITNDDLAKIVDTSDEWITQRTGIKQRHISSGENTSVLVTEVAEKLLERAEVPAESIELIIIASVTPDYGTPSLACMVQKAVGAVNAVAFDVVAACSGFIFALSIADKYIRSAGYQNAIVIGGETLSKIVNWSERSTCVLFGDGAGGAYLEKSQDGGLIAEDIGSAGEQYEILTEGYTACSNAFNGNPARIDPLWYVHMDGREVFKFATKNVIKSLKKVMEENSLEQEDVKYVIPHQANVRIVEVISKKLKIPFEKFYMNMDRYGNTSSASIPIALSELDEKGLIERGDKIILTGFGGGMTWGTMLITW
ncbi:ketoacyl-ACP synthase III [bacterium D16-51]|nr:ketoacyl-ACP synthase III [bacterium D16-59]RKI62685.1 ketoacyl-ACP synthase III [bacterium D16-51]